VAAVAWGFDPGAYPVPVADCSLGWMVDLCTGEAVPKFCGKWDCRRCGPRRIRQLSARMEIEEERERSKVDGQPFNRLITITVADRVEAPNFFRLYESECRKQLRWLKNGWRLARRILHRDWGLTRFQWVRERGPLHGRVHQHLQVYCDYIPKKKLREILVSCGLGKVCDIRRIRDRISVRHYLTKYLVKDVFAPGYSWPRYTRRVQHSLSPEARPPVEPGRWVFERKPKVVVSSYRIPKNCDGGVIYVDPPGRLPADSPEPQYDGVLDIFAQARLVAATTEPRPPPSKPSP
jgi:hypothetical protein